jgi:hypothetical protein
MHDIDHTLSLAELESSFEQPDQVLDEEQVAQLAQQLIEANDEFEFEEAMDGIYYATIPTFELEFEDNDRLSKISDGLLNFAKAVAGPTAGLAANYLTKAGADWAESKGWISKGTKDTLKKYAAPTAGWLTGIGTGLGIKRYDQHQANIQGQTQAAEDDRATEEELEFEGAKNLVRTLSDASRIAVRHKDDGPPATVAKKAFISAVKKHAPHLLNPSQGKAKSGRWTRRGNQIILHGI